MIGSLTRRDFVNGVLVAASGLGAGATESRAETLVRCDGPIGHDPRALRGGNLPATFDVAHWLRDGRLGFDRDSVTLRPGCDGQEGRFTIAEDTGPFDVVVVGAGLAASLPLFACCRSAP
jgi:spermidine dehydrogenase